MTHVTRNTALVLGSAVLAFITGFGGSGAQPAVTIRTGTAHTAEGAISIETNDWTYGCPLTSR